ncbi:MAG: hypothetical protein GC162_14770 [Planctomycetes bacterium]|nr:hypothetical protein [Planctomycetota bacterium]
MWTRITLPAALLLCLTACASGPTHYDHPLAVMLDRQEGLRKRWDAAHQAQAELYADPQRIAVLQKLVWERGYPAEFSNYAVDQLVEINEADAKQFLKSAIVLCKDWETLKHIMNIAVERRWVDFVPALVRNYSLRTPVYRDADRPERAAIEALRPGEPIEQVVMEVFAEGTDATITQRAAAWDLLHRLTDDPDKLIAAMRSIKAKDPLVADLQAGATELGVVPDNPETIAWLQVLRSPEHHDFYAAARDVVAALTPEQRHGLELRHLPTLVWFAKTDAAVLKMTRAQLADKLGRFFDAQPHYLKGPTYDGPMDTHPQRLREWQDQMVWADFVVLEMVTRLMSERPSVEQIFAQADADLADKSTEYGGLIRLTDADHPYAHLYKPMVRRHDLIYYPPKELVLDGYTALAHYHFHAQDYQNQIYAGPGIGDMHRIAATQQFSALVFTFINRDTLNVDYYQPHDVVVDMGVVRR